MASIKEILSSYGSAARANYPQGDDVEDAMDCIVAFIGQHGYEFDNFLLDKLRRELGLCPIHDVFKYTNPCSECEFGIKQGSYYTYYECGFKSKEL